MIFKREATDLQIVAEQVRVHEREDELVHGESEILVELRIGLQEERRIYSGGVSLLMKIAANNI